jgi:co-chaperonin GroES (HSP10)
MEQQTNQLEDIIKHREHIMRTEDKVKGAIQLDKYSGANYDVDTEYQIVAMPFDTLLVHFKDGDGDNVKKGGVFIPTMAGQTKAWRTGQVVMAGRGSQLVKDGDYVTFPNDKGINAKAVNVKGYGVINHCIFIAEDRIFAISEKVEGGTII